MCHGMGLTASRLTCSRSATAAAAAVALSWLPSLDLQSLRNRGSRRRGNGAGCCTRSTCSRSATEAAAAVAMGNRGSRRSGNGAGCCPRPTCSDRQSLRIRGSRRSGNGAGCCTRSTYSDRQSLRNRGSRRSSGNGACGCTALVLRGSSLPRTRHETAADAQPVQLRGGSVQLQVQVGRCQSQPTDAAPCSYGCCWWHSAGTRDHECQRHSASGSAVAAAWTAAQSKAAARQPRSDSTAYIDTPAPAFKSAAPTPQARLLASSRCLLVAAAPTAARRRLHRTAASTRPPMCPQSCTYGCTTRPPMHRRLHRTAAPTAAPTRPPMLPQSCS